jgi:cytosine/adenosine deaminase-related metal-dependent hydrolase
MTVFRAAWVCPISRPPIENGWVAIADGRIAGVGDASDRPVGVPVTDLGVSVMLPGLVNAHTHIELAWLRGRVPPAASFTDWIRQLIIRRGGRRESPDDPAILDACAQAVRDARDYGTALVGDISNSLASVGPIRESGLRGVVFHELLGFNLLDGRRVTETRALRQTAAERGGEAVRVTIAPHACYSVSPQLLQAIHEERLQTPGGITSIHAGESEEEMQFLIEGSGPWPGIIKLVGSWVEGWQPPGMGPVEFLESLGVLDARTLVVHGVRLSETTLERLARVGCTLVTCPRSNQWVGAGVPPIDAFYRAGVRVAVGTDSLASVEDLNVFSELKAMRWIAPEQPARKFLESATRVGADALGFGDELGSLEPGKRADIIAIDLGGPRDDVEEYLVSGIDPRQIQWVHV